jgi:hypothetical protein
MSVRLSLATMVALAAGLALAPVAANAEAVGAAAAVKPASTGTPPGGASRTLQVGTDIQSKERIQTSGSGSLQVMFLDKSSLTIGPNSDLVVDEFVYRQGGGNGAFAARLTKGALRFVGGQISHTSGATIVTPAATIGIRGGAALVTHDAVCQANKEKRGGRDECTKVVCMIGKCNVKSKLDSRTIDLKINQAVEISTLGASQFDVTSVRLNDVTRGGDGSIVAGPSGQNAAASFQGQDTIDQVLTEQAPEPPAPSP